MSLSKLIKGVSMVTLIALIYIHMQMQIYDLAYQAQEQKQRIQKISECNALTAYQILELKSVNHLGGRLLARDQQLRFRDNQSVIQLVTADAPASVEEAMTVPSDSKDNFFLSFLTPKAEARNHPGLGRNLFRILGKDR